MKIRQKLILSLVFLLVFLVGIELVFHFQNHLSFAYVQQEHEWLAQLAAQSIWKMPLLYVLLFWGISALFLPITTLMVIAAGAVFGFWTGLGLAVFSSLSGGCLGFFLARYFFRRPLQSHFHARLLPLNHELQNHGGAYVFLLRMLPGVPFSLTNLLMGVSTVLFPDFLMYSFLGLTPRIALYVNAGTQVASVGSASDILSPAVLASLALLGLLPVLTRWVTKRLKAKFSARAGG